MMHTPSSPPLAPPMVPAPPSPSFLTLFLSSNAFAVSSCLSKFYHYIDDTLYNNVGNDDHERCQSQKQELLRMCYPPCILFICDTNSTNNDTVSNINNNSSNTFRRSEYINTIIGLPLMSPHINQPIFHQVVVCFTFIHNSTAASPNTADNSANDNNCNAPTSIRVVGLHSNGKCADDGNIFYFDATIDVLLSSFNMQQSSGIGDSQPSSLNTSLAIQSTINDMLNLRKFKYIEIIIMSRIPALSLYFVADDVDIKILELYSSVIPHRRYSNTVTAPSSSSIHHPYVLSSSPRSLLVPMLSSSLLQEASSISPLDALCNSAAIRRACCVDIRGLHTMILLNWSATSLSSTNTVNVDSSSISIACNKNSSEHVEENVMAKLLQSFRNSFTKNELNESGDKLSKNSIVRPSPLNHRSFMSPLYCPLSINCLSCIKRDATPWYLNLHLHYIHLLHSHLKELVKFIQNMMYDENNSDSDSDSEDSDDAETNYIDAEWRRPSVAALGLDLYALLQSLCDGIRNEMLGEVQVEHVQTVSSVNDLRGPAFDTSTCKPFTFPTKTLITTRQNISVLASLFMKEFQCLSLSLSTLDPISSSAISDDDILVIMEECVGMKMGLYSWRAFERLIQPVITNIKPLGVNCLSKCYQIMKNSVKNIIQENCQSRGYATVGMMIEDLFFNELNYENVNTATLSPSRNQRIGIGYEAFLAAQSSLSDFLICETQFQFTNDESLKSIDGSEYHGISQNLSDIHRKYLEIINQINKKCEEKGSNGYVDQEFPPKASSIGTIEKIRGSEIVWERLPATCTSSPSVLESHKHYTNSTQDRFCLAPPTQGAVGDCFFVSALSSLVIKKKYFYLLNNLYINKTYSKYGCYGVVLHHNHAWRPVIVDDYVPVLNGTHTPLFASSESTSVIYSSVIEKAYAKLSSSYEHIEGGTQTEAFTTLTGGVCLLIDIRRDGYRYCKGDNTSTSPSNIENEDKEMSDDDVWLQLEHHDQAGHLMGCSILTHKSNHQSNTSKSTYEVETSHGLLLNHAYAIIALKTLVLDSNNKVRLLRIRNPHGGARPGQSSSPVNQWTGDWGAQSVQWQRLSVSQKLYLLSNDDEEPAASTNSNSNNLNYNDIGGSFFISISDFKYYFDKLEICLIFPPNYAQVTLKSSWSTALGTAGGCQNNVNKNAFINNNNQFQITVAKPHCHMTIVLSNEDRRSNSGNGEYPSIGMYLLRSAGPGQRITKPICINDDLIKLRAFIKVLLQLTTIAVKSGRDVSVSVTLTPSDSNCRYVLLPCTFIPNVDATYFIKIICDCNFEIKKLNLLNDEKESKINTQPNSVVNKANGDDDDDDDLFKWPSDHSNGHSANKSDVEVVQVIMTSSDTDHGSVNSNLVPVPSNNRSSNSSDADNYNHYPHDIAVAIRIFRSKLLLYFNLVRQQLSDFIPKLILFHFKFFFDKCFGTMVEEIYIPGPSLWSGLSLQSSFKDSDSSNIMKSNYKSESNVKKYYQRKHKHAILEYCQELLKNSSIMISALEDEQRTLLKPKK